MRFEDFDSLDFSPYSFASTQRRRGDGLLLRAGKGRDFGYACIHSWPHLGDPTIESIKSMLRDPICTQLLIARARENLLLDYQARLRKESLFSAEALPSHLQIDMGPDFRTSHIASLKQAGFRTLKIKMPADATAASEKVKSLESQLGHLKLRLDFNSSLTPESFRAFLRSLGPDLLDAIDFVEDPFPLSEDWALIQTEFKIRLAADFEKALPLDPQFENCFDVLVLKPSLDDLQSWVSLAHQQMKRVVLTSYLQHPVGRAFDFYWAQRISQEHPLLVDETGFLNEDASPRLGDFSFFDPHHSMVSAPRQEAGIGFGEALKREAWQKLW